LFLNIISLFGSLFLIYLAYKVSKINQIKTDKEKIFTATNIFTITLFNGSLRLSWLTIFLPQAFELRKHVFWGEFIFLLVYEMFWLCGLLTVSFIFSRFKSFLTKQKLSYYMFKVFALLLLFFALQTIYNVMNFLKTYPWYNPTPPA
jgi:threonine/homoserine/homoserine lactone efflux protein